MSIFRSSCLLHDGEVDGLVQKPHVSLQKYLNVLSSHSDSFSESNVFIRLEHPGSSIHITENNRQMKLTFYENMQNDNL